VLLIVLFRFAFRPRRSYGPDESALEVTEP
jgi:hypothetical protein